MNPKLHEKINIDIDEQLKEPSQYKVILLNDDYTTKDFVVDILVKVFRKNEEDAIIIMEKVHVMGSAEVGVYSYDIASTKVNIALKQARKEGFPMQCKMEEC